MLKENFGDLVFDTRIRKTVRYAEAPVQGSSVLKYDPTGPPPRPTASSRRRCSMARRRASMREGPLAELFRATEAAQRQARKRAGPGPAEEPDAASRRRPDSRGSRPAEPTRRRPRRLPLRRSAPGAAARDAEAPAPPKQREAARTLTGRRAAGPPPACSSPRRACARTPRPDSAAYLAVIRVVGVGGGGLNAVNRMIEAGISQVEFIAVNTDIQQLQMCEAPVKLHIGRELTQGLGSGSDPEVGRRAAEDAADQIKHVLRGLGHGLRHRRRGRRHRLRRRPGRRAHRPGRRRAHGRHRHDALPLRGHAPPLAGRRRASTALREVCDTVIVIPNDRLLEVLDRSTSMIDAFRIADDVLRQGVQGICDLITMPGLINLDFADVRTIMTNAGSALMGIGFATGESRGAGGGRARAPLSADRRRARRARGASCSPSPAATTSACSR